MNINHLIFSLIDLIIMFNYRFRVIDSLMKLEIGILISYTVRYNKWVKIHQYLFRILLMQRRIKELSMSVQNLWFKTILRLIWI